LIEEHAVIDSATDAIVINLSAFIISLRFVDVITS